MPAMSLDNALGHFRSVLMQRGQYLRERAGDALATRRRTKYRGTAERLKSGPIMDEISFMHRVKAARIIKKLRDQIHLKDVANMFNTSKTYITYCEHLTQRIDRKTGLKIEYNYLCPKAVIRNILDWADAL